MLFTSLNGLTLKRILGKIPITQSQQNKIKVNINSDAIKDDEYEKNSALKSLQTKLAQTHQPVKRQIRAPAKSDIITDTMTLPDTLSRRRQSPDDAMTHLSNANAVSGQNNHFEPPILKQESFFSFDSKVSSPTAFDLISPTLISVKKQIFSMEVTEKINLLLVAGRVDKIMIVGEISLKVPSNILAISSTVSAVAIKNSHLLEKLVPNEKFVKTDLAGNHLILFSNMISLERETCVPVFKYQLKIVNPLDFVPIEIIPTWSFAEYQTVLDVTCRIHPAYLGLLHFKPFKVSIRGTAGWGVVTTFPVAEQLPECIIWNLSGASESISLSCIITKSVDPLPVFVEFSVNSLISALDVSMETADVLVKKLFVTGHFACK